MKEMQGVAQHIGEFDPPLSSELIHSETIAARSALLAWEIEPHRHASLTQIVFVSAGTFQITVETSIWKLSGPSLVFIPPRLVHGYSFSPGTEGHVITLPSTLLKELLALSPQVHGHLGEFRLHALEPDSGRHEAIANHMARFVDEYADQRPGRTSMLAAHLTQIAIWLTRLDNHPDRSFSLHDACTTARARIERFQELIEAHYHEWRPLAFYADRLGLSMRSLQELSRRVTGRTAQAMIHDRLLTEARRLLAHSELSVTSISYTLGFRDPAYFSRFFARTQQRSPSDFRSTCRPA